jgi:hypothetical protein
MRATLKAFTSLRHGDVVDPVHRDEGRCWVILKVTADDIKAGVDARRAGLYAFGGMWYGKKKADHSSYGKMLHLSELADDGKVRLIGTIRDFTVRGLKKITC